MKTALAPLRPARIKSRYSAAVFVQPMSEKRWTGALSCARRLRSALDLAPQLSPRLLSNHWFNQKNYRTTRFPFGRVVIGMAGIRQSGCAKLISVCCLNRKRLVPVYS